MASGKANIKQDADIFDEIVIQWNKPPIFGRPNIRIVVSGLIGAGKSTLVNSLTGINKCKIGESGDGGSYTLTVQKIWRKFGSTWVLVCDTPGFKYTDGNGQLVKHRVYDYFKSESNCNVFIYSIRMTATRFEANSPDLKVLREVSHKCGGKNWRNAVICLTNANICVKAFKESHPDADIKAKYHDRLQEWTRELRRFMKSELYLEDNVIQNIPIVAAGFPERTRLETEPEGTSWINNLWLAILSTTKESLYSQPILIGILEQMIFGSSDTGSSDVSLFLQHHQLCYLQKAQQSKTCHDLERKRIVGLACSFFTSPKVHAEISHITTASQKL